MAAAPVRWGTQEQRAASVRPVVVATCLGVLVLLGTPVAAVGVLAVLGLDEEPRPGGVAGTLLVIVLVVVGLAAIANRVVNTWRRAFWLVTDAYGVTLWRGGERTPLLTIPAPSIDAVELTPDAADGAAVLRMRLRPRLDPLTIDARVTEVGRGLLLGDPAAAREWDLALAVDRRDGEPTALAEEIRRVAAGAPQ